NHEPESADNALLVYSQLMMPERNTRETIQRLTPLLNDPELQKKIDQAASESATDPKRTALDSLSNEVEEANNKKAMYLKMEETYQLSQVVGILIGSPEFQRR
ncbi:MAG: hypothetical protein ABI663_14715, partial [Chryseolinea sp.]